MLRVKGIHHISAIVSDPQDNVDFNASFLGLKPICKTVNFDDKMTYHLYYGNSDASLGSLLTYFAWDKMLAPGLIGDGQVGIVSLAIHARSVSFWQDRLNNFKLKYSFDSNNNVLSFTDSTNLKYELVVDNSADVSNYSFNGITSNNAIKGIYKATLYSKYPDQTKDFLINFLGLKFISEDENKISMQSDAKIGKYVDLMKKRQGIGKMGVGTVHHIAFSVPESELALWQQKLVDNNIYVGAIKDRDFFKSIYFREPGGIIIELATDKPGFSGFDNGFDKLYLPKQYQADHDKLINTLKPITVNEIKELKYEENDSLASKTNHRQLLNEINNLANIAKTRALTTSELEQRSKLRKEYISIILSNVKNLVTNIKVEESVEE